MNEYKQWSNEKIIETGKRLKHLLPLAYKEMKAMPQNDILKLLSYAGEINKAETLIEALRNEIKKRYATTNNTIIRP